MDEEEVKEVETVPIIENELSDENIDELIESINDLVEFLKEKEETEVKEKELLEKKEKENLETLKKEELKQEQIEKDNLLLSADEKTMEDLYEQLGTSNKTTDLIQQTLVETNEILSVEQEQIAQHAAADIVSLYGLVVIPAAIIIFAFWKMIKPFLP